jgi:DNA-binding MurR/RpiR family transcriptional regulator
VFAVEIKAIQDTVALIDTEAFKRAANYIFSAQKVEFYSFGNSRPITFDIHYRMLKIGINSYVGIDIADTLIHANMLNPGEVAIAVSHSGSTKYTCMALEAAHDRGAQTICITAFPESPITRVSDICLFAATNDEFDFTTTTFTSKTAEMAIMDALYTAVAFRKGESAKQYIKFTDRIVYVERY